MATAKRFDSSSIQILIIATIFLDYYQMDFKNTSQSYFIADLGKLNEGGFVFLSLSKAVKGFGWSIQVTCFRF